MRNFGLVRDKLRSIVLRSDVGITEQAWELREEEQTRVRNLLTERLVPNGCSTRNSAKCLTTPATTLRSKEVNGARHRLEQAA